MKVGNPVDENQLTARWTAHTPSARPHLRVSTPLLKARPFADGGFCERDPKAVNCTSSGCPALGWAVFWPAAHLCLLSGVSAAGGEERRDARTVLERHKEVNEADRKRTLLLIQLFFLPHHISGVFQEHTSHLYMAKFLAELLGCTLPDKGTPPLFEVRML